MLFSVPYSLKISLAFLPNFFFFSCYPSHFIPGRRNLELTGGKIVSYFVIWGGYTCKTQCSWPGAQISPTDLYTHSSEGLLWHVTDCHVKVHVAIIHSRCEESWRPDFVSRNGGKETAEKRPEPNPVGRRGDWAVIKITLCVGLQRGWELCSGSIR